MNLEGQFVDRKSIRVLAGAEGGFSELAKDCVAFANAKGGCLLIGIEDGALLPPPTQRVDDAQVEAPQKRIPQLTVNVGVVVRKLTAENGGEYIELEVFPSRNSIAGTSDGRYFIRVSDESRPLMPDELGRLMGDKTAYVWESHAPKRVPARHADETKKHTFLEMIRDSERVTPFVKDKTDQEILEHYLFVHDQFLTNLGTLWIGRREDRAVLRYAPVIQCIKYDEADRKINKWLWDDFDLNPLEMIEAVWKEIPDWRESQEIPDGLFRTTVPQYDEVVVREVLANALVHRPYTQGGDIFLNLYTDRLEIHNPGLLPLGVTPQNILHTTVKRNEHLARVFYDLRMMEREGSGYDRMYEVLLSAGKPLPEVQEGNDRVTVTVRKRIANPAILDFIAKADQTFQMSRKEKITLGLLAQHEALTAIALCHLLDLRKTEDIRHWLGNLPKWELVSTRGRAKGTEYCVHPELLRKLDFRGATTLRGIESHRLRELILRDLEIYREASISDIHQRIGHEIPIRKIKYLLTKLYDEGAIGRTGSKRGVRYLWTKSA